MKRLLIGCLAVPLFAMACGDPMEVATPNNGGINTVKQGVAPNRYIVVLNPGTNASTNARQLAAAHGGNVTAVWEHALNGFAIEISPQGLNGLQNSPAVKYVEPDIVISKLADEQVAPTGIRRIEAHLDPIAAAGSVNSTVAIIDTGVDADHPDLDGLVVAHVDCAGGGPHGRKGCEPGGTDGNGHGTHVAGTVAALDNDIGVVGVAPGAGLVGVRVLDDRGSGYMSWIINGVDWVTENRATHGIDVANMSLGGAGGSKALEDAIGNSVAAGILYTVAAGNSSDDIHDSDGNCAYTPACIDAAMTISALADSDGAPGGLGDESSYGPDDSFATFSNFSSLNGIDLILPGVDINSTVPGGGYAEYSGTSMAAPHAAGLAALEIARRKANGESTDVNTVRQALVDAAKAQDSADGLVHLNDPDGNWEPLGYAIAADLGCTTDDDCTTGYGCVDGTCQSLCGNGTCDDGEDFDSCPEDCGECADNLDCTEDLLPYCSAEQICVECTINDNCTDGVCDDNTCVECTADTDCTGGVCTDDNTCVECTVDTDCTDGVCADDNTCVECSVDDDCTDGVCQDNACVEVECTIDDDCADGYVCSDQNTCEAAPQCFAVDEPCDVDSDCCSNKCRGGGPKGSFCK